METLSALLALCAGNSPVTGEFPSQMPVTRSFDILFDLCLNERLSKWLRGWWFETPSRSLWCHCTMVVTYAAGWLIHVSNDASGWVVEEVRGVHEDVMSWKRFPHYWPFVKGIHRHNIQQGAKLRHTATAVWTYRRVLDFHIEQLFVAVYYYVYNIILLECCIFVSRKQM